MAGLNLLVIGRPGVGKTTLALGVVQQMRGTLRLAGFTTNEVRGLTGQRVGFDIVTVDGRKGVLARVGTGSRVRVGRYGVDLEQFERIALPELRRRDADLIVIDEIGKMECTSEGFRHAVEEVLDAPVNVLATLGIGPLLFFQAVRARPDVELINLTEHNRDALVAELCRRLKKS